MLIINHVWVFVLNTLTAQVGVILRKVFVSVFDRVLIMDRTPDHHAD